MSHRWIEAHCKRFRLSTVSISRVIQEKGVVQFKENYCKATKGGLPGTCTSSSLQRMLFYCYKLAVKGDFGTGCLWSTKINSFFAALNVRGSIDAAGGQYLSFKVTQEKSVFFLWPIDHQAHYRQKNWRNLRIPDTYEAKIEKIGNFRTFWPVIQLKNHLFKIQKKMVY